MDIKLICMDLDGTALLSDRNSFSPRLCNALNAAHEKGITIVPVTGRQFHILPQAIKDNPGWLDLVVLCNGGQIRRFATQEILHQLPIPQPALHQLLNLSAKYNLPIEFSVDSILHLTQKSLDQQQDDPHLEFHRDFVLKNYGKVVDSLEPICDLAVEKVNLIHVSGAIRENVLRDLDVIAVSAVFAGPESMEITHPDASKGNALETLCRMLDIPLENTMAIGDSGNDISMLKKAGLGIAMGNAPEFVKAAADMVTAPCKEDGAATAIEQFAL